MKPPSAKRQILAEVADTMSRDPFSVQFLRPWIWSLLPGHDPLTDELPWMNFRVIRWLRSYLGPEMDVFEYGSGGSTVFAAKRVRKVVSVEHDPAWHARVLSALRAQGITNCDLRLVLPDPCSSLQEVPYGPRSYTSRTSHAAGLRFEAYVKTIDEFPDHSLDLVVVDGYSRFSCVGHAIPKVRPGGYLLVDDTDWRKHREIVAYLDKYQRTDFVGATPFQRNFRQTTTWRL